MRILIYVLCLIIANVATAATAKKQVRKAPAKQKQTQERSNLQTDISFNDSVLHGQYQTPEEANVRVENETALSDLIGVRAHFQDQF